MRRQCKILLNLILPLALVCLAPACRRNHLSSPPAAAPLMEKVSSGPIELTVIAEPAQVHLDRDILLTFRVSAPSNMEVRLPPLENRLKGFVLNGSFTRDAVDKDGNLSHASRGPAKEYCFRLTPTLADEYRIAPMAVTWINRAEEPAAEGWFMSRPLSFQAAEIAKGPPAVSIHDIIGPVWIHPPFKTIALWTIAILAVAGVIFLLWRISKRIHKAIKLRRMSPKERALYELNELLAQDFITKQKIKEFYLEITMIVRRYIERSHAIRAPEQTTEEFLAAAVHNADFSREVVARLRAFLQTADLVKFAAYLPDRRIIDQTISTARDYIETDEQAEKGVGKP